MICLLVCSCLFLFDAVIVTEAARVNNTYDTWSWTIDDQHMVTVPHNQAVRSILLNYTALPGIYLESSIQKHALLWQSLLCTAPVLHAARTFAEEIITPSVHQFRLTISSNHPLGASVEPIIAWRLRRFHKAISFPGFGWKRWTHVCLTGTSHNTSCTFED